MMKEPIIIILHLVLRGLRYGIKKQYFIISTENIVLGSITEKQGGSNGAST